MIKKAVKKKLTKQIKNKKITSQKIASSPKIPAGIIFLQARISSSRLPGKVLKTVERKELLVYLIERLLTSGFLVVLLVPATEKHAFTKITRKFPMLSIFAGAQHHVLSRFYHAAKKFPARNYIRVTGDNPFTSITCLKEIFIKHLRVKSDVSYYQNLPYGAGVEVVSAKALRLAYWEAQTKVEREHVTPWLHERLAIYRATEQMTSKSAKLSVIRYKNYLLKFFTPMAPAHYNYPSLRVTVDTLEDFEKFKIRVLDLKKQGLSYSLADLLKLVKKLFS